MFNREERTAERDKNREVLKDVARKREEILARKIDKAQRQYEQIEAEIKKLQDQKSELMSGAVTKAEILTKAKEQLSARKEQSVEMILVKHLSECQASNVMPFAGDHTIPDHQLGRLFFFAISEKDVENAVALLPDIGMSMAEREAKIEEINQEISKLQKIIKDDLEVEKSKA